jgi:hypothetical protein
MRPRRVIRSRAVRAGRLTPSPRGRLHRRPTSAKLPVVTPESMTRSIVFLSDFGYRNGGAAVGSDASALPALFVCT